MPLQYKQPFQSHLHSEVRDSFRLVQPCRQIFQLPCKPFPSQSYLSQLYNRHPEQRDHPYILLLNELQYLRPIQLDDRELELQKYYLQ